jgi:hypothetical protein
MIAFLVTTKGQLIVVAHIVAVVPMRDGTSEILTGPGVIYADARSLDGIAEAIKTALENARGNGVLGLS